ncbi:MAG TPA: Ger(x)C family spore germination protein [Bacilli bacterium]|nr:Ger(x)C family spore germination protein [Bacilli bacterium]
MKRWLVWVLVLAVVGSGCSPNSRSKQKLLERLGVISAVGYDMTDKQDFKLGTFVLPNFTETGKEKVDVLTASGRTSKEMRFNMSRMSERQLVGGQIRVVLYGDELAKEGILPLSDTLFRDAEIGSQIHLAVVDGRAVDMLTHRYPDKPSVDIYLYQMLRKEMEQNTIPLSNLHLFLHDAYNAGADPVLPYLELGQEDVILNGVAVFNEDRMVGRLSGEETRALAYMYGRNSVGAIEANVDESGPHGTPGRAVMMYLKLNRKREVSVVKGIPHFHLLYSIDGGITEYTGEQNLEEEPVVKQLETKLADKLRGQMERVVEKLQHEFHSDPLGFGELYRSRGYVKKLEEKTWRKLYEKAKIDIDVKITIKQTGMIH